MYHIDTLVSQKKGEGRNGSLHELEQTGSSVPQKLYNPGMKYYGMEINELKRLTEKMALTA